MDFSKQNVGVDVDSKKMKACFRWIDSHQHIKTKGSRTFDNTAKGFKELMIWAEKNKTPDHPVHITMEATGVYYEQLAYFFNEQKDYIVHVLLPNITNAFFKSLNLKSKTDEIDAKALAQMGLERKLKLWQPGSMEMRNIKKLVRERLRLQTESTMVSNQLHAEISSYIPFENIVIRYKDRIAFIKQQIAIIEKELRTCVDLDPRLKERIANVCTAIGVGFITAIGVVAEMDGFTLFNNRNQVISYSGYDVVQNTSGQTIRGKTKISKRGNSYIRRMLYLPAMAAVRHDQHHAKYCNRIIDKTSIKMKGYVAIQRKLLLLIYTLYTKNVPFDPLYQQKIEDERKAKMNKDKQQTEQKNRSAFQKMINEVVDHA